jgi:hypothetical protein
MEIGRKGVGALKRRADWAVNAEAPPAAVGYGTIE